MSRDGAAGAECRVDVCLRPLMASVLLSPFHTAAHHFVAMLPACQGGKGTSLLRTTILLQPVLQSELYLLSLPPFCLVGLECWGWNPGCDAGQAVLCHSTNQHRSPR